MKGNMSPGRGSGMERGLRFEPGRADKAHMGSSWEPGNAHASAFRLRARERGQALVEFALIVPVFLILVLGLIQFGVGLNYWLDLNRLANQGARWAVVNCNPASANVCRTKNSPQVDNIEAALKEQRTSRFNNMTVKVCTETAGPGGRAPGQPLTVLLETPLAFKQLLNLPGITIRGRATMRIEQNLTHPALAPGIVGDCASP
jgi:hypothetical protein